jgi:hypothetical protein
MRISLIVLFVFTVQLFNISFAQKKGKKQQEDWTTFAEKTNFQETPRYKETIEYCKKLEEGSKWVKYIPFGRSAEERELPMMILSKEKSFKPEAQHASKKALVMIQCGIHAGEIDGKDAMLMLMRDIVIIKKYENLLDNVNLMIIPIFNVDGHEKMSPYNRINQNGPKEMGWRVTANNLNLNRDYLKADAIEMKFWLKLFSTYLPDFFIDCHVTDGADFPYDVTYMIETNENISNGLANWTRDNFLPYVTSNLEKTGHLMAPYGDFKDEFDISKGFSSGVMSPKLSTGYTAIQNRQGFLIETHSYKDYKTRVDATYQLVRIIIEYINKDYKLLKELNVQADMECENMFYRKEPFPLAFEISSESKPFLFKSFKVNKDFSNISGTYAKSFTHEIIEKNVPFYNSVTISKSIKPPFAYLIPQAWSDLVDILLLHGIRIGRLVEDFTILVEDYKLNNPKWQERPYEGRHMVTFKAEKKITPMTFPKGTFIIPINQRASKVVLYLLEPESNESFVNWGFMDAIFEQKEYAEPYILEKLASEMLSKDSTLKSEFENKLRTDTTFAKKPYERLNFFYKKSPFWDKNFGMYPIVRLMDKQNFIK